MLGAVFQFNGQRPLTAQPLKSEYSTHDFSRIARLHNISWILPETFPVATQAAGRVYYWINQTDSALAKKFAKAALNTYFGKGINIQSRETVADIAAEVGCTAEDAIAATNDDVVKQLLKDATEEAIERNVCGSPFFFVDDEPFWGSDRIDMIGRWLETGGW